MLFNLEYFENATFYENDHNFVVLRLNSFEIHKTFRGHFYIITYEISLRTKDCRLCQMLPTKISLYLFRHPV